MMPLQSFERYPAYVFPSTLRDAIHELQFNTKAPLSLIGSSILSSISIACQGIADVERLNGLISPVSVWTVTVADSGERKTYIDGKVALPIREFEAKKSGDLAESQKSYEVAIKVWKTVEKVILRAIERSIQKGESVEDLSMRLRAHCQNKPLPPAPFRILYSDVTPGALRSGLFESGNSVALTSDEGDSLFSGHALRDLSLANTLWGGGEIRTDRADRHLVVRAPRLTISVMVQSGPFQRYLERKGDAARDSGFLARFLVAHPSSTQGSRFIHNPEAQWDKLSAFHGRLRELLERNFDSDGNPASKAVLKFSPQALHRWIEAYNTIESWLNPGEAYFNIRDYAAKIAENVARVAALFHLFEGREGNISCDTLEQAIDVVKWYADEFLRLFSPLPAIPQERTDANALEVWLAYQVLHTGFLTFRKNVILKHAPRALRQRDRLNAALDILFCTGVVLPRMEGKTIWIDLNPDRFTPDEVRRVCALSALQA